MPIRALLLDKDGTLVDFEATWGPAALAVMRRLSGGDGARFARLAEAARYDHAAGRLDAASPLIAGSSPDFVQAWAEAAGRAATPEFLVELDGMFHEEAAGTLRAIEGARETLAALKARGLTMAVLTNDTEAGARRHCERLGFMPYLETVYGYDTGHGAKPEPGAVLAFAREYGVAPAEIAVVGDAWHDMRAAQAAGAVGIGVLTGPGDRAALERDATHLIGAITGLPDLLDRLDAEPARPDSRA